MDPAGFRQRKMKALLVIPARYGATRFPGKSLARIQGRPMIQWVWEAAMRSRLAEQTVIATDDSRIATSRPNSARMW